MAKKPYGTGSTSLADFKQLSLLGEGAYSAVYKVMRLADRELYALKKVKLPSLSDKEKQNALNEVRLLASVHHDSIIAYKEAFFDDKTRCLCIVQEYADGGDISHQITKCQKDRSHLREADVWRILLGMCHGLKALHDMRILHRDLKCANVFLHHSVDNPQETVAKLGDFNVSKVAKRGLCMTQTGTPYYASPEVWRDMPYDAKSDMWSLGCVLYEMLALRPPFRAEDMEGLYRKVLRGHYPHIPPHYSHDISEVVGVLLQVNPRHRPSIDQLLEMPQMRRHAPEMTDSDEQRPSDLLQTIKLPKNVIDLSICLPKPQYDYTSALLEERKLAAQESAADIAGGGSVATGLNAQGSHQDGGSPSSQDMLHPHGGGGADDGCGGGGGHGGGLPRPAAPESDSLDAYLQQKDRQPPPAPPQQHPYHHRGGGHHPRGGHEPEMMRENRDYVDQQQLRDFSQPRGGGRLPQLDHQNGRGSAQASPTAQRGGQQPLYGGREQYQRREREPRRPMASYARAQYSLSQANAAGAGQHQAPKQTGGGDGGGLKLPRIFSKG